MKKKQCLATGESECSVECTYHHHAVTILTLASPLTLPSPLPSRHRHLHVVATTTRHHHHQQAAFVGCLSLSHRAPLFYHRHCHRHHFLFSFLPSILDIPPSFANLPYPTPQDDDAPDLYINEASSMSGVLGKYVRTPFFLRPQSVCTSFLPSFLPSFISGCLPVCFLFRAFFFTLFCLHAFIPAYLPSIYAFSPEMGLPFLSFLHYCY